MNNFTKKSSSGGDLRSFLKIQHRKVYSICRLFANNYREQQQLFISMLAAVSQSITGMKSASDKNDILLRACINMVALHTLSQRTHEIKSREIQFKSHDFQKTMVQFRESVGEISDFEKIRLFLKLEGVEAAKISSLTGISAVRRKPAKEQYAKQQSVTSKNFLPFIKQKLVWN